MKKKSVIISCAMAIISAAVITMAHAEGTGEDCNTLRIECQACKSTSLAGNNKPFVKLGKPAPDFRLEGVVSTEAGKEFKTFTLNDFKNKWLVVFFYPADFTFVCPTEIRGFNDRIDNLRKLNAEVVAVSTDSKWSHLAWIQRGDLGRLNYPLLADFNKETAYTYGVLDAEQGVALRGLFIIDPAGIVQYQVIHNLDVGRSVDEILRVLEALQTGGLCPIGWKPGQKTLGK